MSKDIVKQYQQAVAALQLEKASLQKDLSSAQATVASAEKRLAEIEAALGGSAKVSPAKRRGRPAGKSKAAKPAAKKPAKKATKKATKKTAKKAVEKAAKKTVKKVAKKAPAKSGKNKTTLKDVVLELTKGKALDAKQIFESAKKAGHKFGGKNPMNSIRVLLYTNKKLFKNDKGKFTAA